MTGSTISTSVYAQVELGAGTYKSPLTITSTGLINPADAGYGDTGIYLLNSATIATIINHGRVYGAIGGYGNDFGTGGGIAILLNSAAFLSNSDLIAGGNGETGSDSEDGGIGGNGGIGVDVLAVSTISNSSTGVIRGGYGGYAYNKASNGGNFYGRPGYGGAGVDLQTGSTFNNAGVVAGGGGGNAAQFTTVVANGGAGVIDTAEANITNSGVITGGAGGIQGLAGTPRGLAGGRGVVMQDLGHLANSGTITGGAGGARGNIQFGGIGAEGVYLFQATASNTGVIRGGAGAEGSGAGGFGGGGGTGAGVYNYASLSNAKGSITGGAGGEGLYALGGGRGGNGIFVGSYGTVNNTGHITGGAGGYAAGTQNTDGAGFGGIGVYLESGRLTNSGTIAGGNGGAQGSASTITSQFAGIGGTGVGTGTGSQDPHGGASIINYGVILGGNGGNINGHGGYAGAGGAGISVKDASFSNHGTIIGGHGGVTGQAAYDYGRGGAGGSGAVAGIGGTVNNIGTIIGGTGGSNIYLGTVGGAGVYIAGGVFNDTGKVIGGAAGFSQGPGTAGDAVQFGGTIAGTLVAGAGAVFTGGIAGNYSVANVIELTGTSATRFAGIGVSVTGVADFSFASGAQRSIEGTNYGLSALSITGFAVHDTIVIDNFTANLTATSADPGPYFELFDNAATARLDITRAAAKEFLVTDLGGKTTITAAAPTIARTLTSGMAEFAGAGANATGTTVKTGGFEEIYNGGTATSTTIAGGALLVNTGAAIRTGIAFSTITGGTLAIDSATLPTVTISGFIAGDTIDLAGIAYNSNDKVTVGTAGTVTISTPGIAYKLDIAGATVGETDFKFSTGSVLTKTTAKQALTFISTPELSTTGTGAPHIAGADIFLAYARHQLALESLSIAHAQLAPTPAAAGILAFHPEAHTLLVPQGS